MLRFFRHYIPLPTIAFGVVEIFFLFWMFYVYHSRATAGAVTEGDSVTLSAAFALSIFLTMFSFGLYSRAIFIRRREMLIRVLLSFSLIIPLFIIATNIVFWYVPQAILLARWFQTRHHALIVIPDIVVRAAL